MRLHSEIHVRAAQSDDLASIVRLDRLAFAPQRTDSEIQTEWFGEGLDGPNRWFFVAVERVANQAIGAYVQLDLSLTFTQVEYPLVGIAAVSVAPHYRGRGIAQQMLEHALETGRSQRCPLMMLYPFQHGFYRKLGWAWVGQTMQYRVAARHLPSYPERAKIQPYDPATQANSLYTAYQTAAIAQNGWLKRSPHQWEQRLRARAGQEVYCYLEDQVVEGYIIFQFAVVAGQLSAIVQEWVATTPSAYRGILGFLSHLRDQVAVVIWNTYRDDPFPHLLKEQRSAEILQPAPFEFGLTHAFGQVGGGFMWRLVDVGAAFERRSLQAHSPFVARFQIEDTVLGHQSITFEFAENKVHQTSTSPQTTIALSIEHLTQLFAGFRRSQDLMWTGEIAIEGDRAVLPQLDAALATGDPFCWDFF